MLNVKIPTGEREVSVFGLTQWDRGQKISLSFDGMPEKFQVHFSSRGSAEAIVVDAAGVGGNALVDIPDEMLVNASDIIAWVYLTGENSGETVAKITMYVMPRSRPAGFMEELVPSQQQLVENMLRDIRSNLDYVLSNGVDSEYFPDYVKSEALETAKKVLSSQNENTVSFLVSGDYNYDMSDKNNCKSISHMASAMKLIRSMCKIDFALCLGGYIADKNDKGISEGLSEFFEVNKALSEGSGNLPCLRAVGGDDLLLSAYYGNGDYFDCEKLHSLVGKWCEKAVFNPVDKTGGYCYIDFEDKALRVICLNTSDFKKGDEVNPETEKAHISTKQLAWLCSALDMSEKEDYANWSTLIMSHYPINYYKNFMVLQLVIKAYTKGSELELYDNDGEAVCYDFSKGNNSAKILAILNGALRNFKVNILEDTEIPLISIPNASIGNENYFADDKYSAEENLLYGENATWEKTPFSENDTAFCVVTLDKSEGKMTLHCYGAGYDREIDLNNPDNLPVAPPVSGGDGNEDGDDTGNTGGGSDDDNESGGGITPPIVDYENIIAYAVDEDGAVYNNGLGYMDGYALETDGSVSSTAESDYTHTGYFYMEKGDYMCVKGFDRTDSEGNLLIIYNEDYNMIYTAETGPTASASRGVSFSGGVMTFDTTKFTAGNLPDNFFVRLSAKAKGKDLIITYNAKLA